MYTSKWLQPLLIAALTLSPMASNAQFIVEDLVEEYDVQSPEEIERARQEIEALFDGDDNPVKSLDEKTDILAKYKHLDPKKEIPTDLLEKTVLFFDKNLSKFPNQAYISIVDMRPHSKEQRFFVVNMATGEVEKFRTTHGINSDKNDDGLAEQFGNVVNSGKSSLGFIRTGEVYWGKFKRSIRLDGLSATNSNVRKRAIVVHGWDNVSEAPIKQGRSWGCLTLDWALKDAVIDKIKEGSLMYVDVAAKAKKPTN